MLGYAALVYHLPLLIAFSVSQATSFVWGGCMMFPLEAMLNDTYGIMQVLHTARMSYALQTVYVYYVLHTMCLVYGRARHYV